MAQKLLGIRGYRVTRDNESHRDYVVKWLIEADKDDGPAAIMETPGLPLIGAPWTYGGNDPWAACQPSLSIYVHEETEGEKPRFWAADQTFSTRPMFRCDSAQAGDPLLEPQKVSGSFVKRTKQAIFDRHGDVIKFSNHEPVTGSKVEFDESRPTVRVEQNMLTLGLATFSAMVNTVNDGPMWGLSKRKIKLSNVTWEQKFYGACYKYFTRIFDFDVDFNTFDHTIPDYGTSVLNGELINGVFTLIPVDGQPPDPTNPRHFVNWAKINGGDGGKGVYLNGQGIPVSDISQAAEIVIEYYPETNLLSLGVPLILG